MTGIPPRDAQPTDPDHWRRRAELHRASQRSRLETVKFARDMWRLNKQKGFTNRADAMRASMRAVLRDAAAFARAKRSALRLMKVAK